MCLTIIDLATSWFKIVELPTATKSTVPTKGKGKKVAFDNYYIKVSETIFDKSCAQISNLCIPLENWANANIFADQHLSQTKVWCTQWVSFKYYK